MSELKIIKTIHLILGLLWIYQGIFPKLIFTSRDEIAMWQFIGLSSDTARLFGQMGGIAEIIFGIVFIFCIHRALHYLNIIAMFGLLILAAITLPHTLIAAFNPVVMNLAMASLSLIALMLMHAQNSANKR